MLPAIFAVTHRGTMIGLPDFSPLPHSRPKPAIFPAADDFSPPGIAAARICYAIIARRTDGAYRRVESTALSSFGVIGKTLPVSIVAGRRRQSGDILLAGESLSRRFMIVNVSATAFGEGRFHSQKWRRSPQAATGITSKRDGAKRGAGSRRPLALQGDALSMPGRRRGSARRSWHRAHCRTGRGAVAAAMFLADGAGGAGCTSARRRCLARSPSCRLSLPTPALPDDALSLIALGRRLRYRGDYRRVIRRGDARTSRRVNFFSAAICLRRSSMSYQEIPDGITGGVSMPRCRLGDCVGVGSSRSRRHASHVPATRCRPRPRRRRHYRPRRG